MNDISKDIMDLLERYGTDTKLALKEHSHLAYLYALSDMRENLLEWYPFKAEGRLLQWGSDYGALTGLYSRRVSEVVVLDESEENLRVNGMRHGESGNITYVKSGLPEYGAGLGGQEEQAFDYVVLIGSLTEDCQRQIEAAKSLLKPDGELIVAVCNRFGMKYWAGAKRDELNLTRKGLVKLMGGNEKDLEFHYPMPDYKIPVSIYSQAYLPGKGDLTQTLTVYDYPKYMFLDVGAYYDAVCEDGQFENFANSFLVIWRNHGTD